MRKELFKLTIVAFLLTISSMLAAQTATTAEGVASGKSATWQVAPAGVTLPWTVSGSGIEGISAALPCPAPDNLQALRITSNSATLSWSSEALTFQVKVSTAALSDPATGAANVCDSIVSVSNHALVGLTPSTTYYYYVKADCGDGDVAWSSGQFTTRCSSVNIPYSQNFNGSATDFNNCWTKRFTPAGNWNGVTPDPAVYTPATSGDRIHGSTGSAAKMYAYWDADWQGNQYGTSAWIATPELNVANIQTVQVRFFAYNINVADTLHIGVMLDPEDESSFQEIWKLSFSQASVWKDFVVPMTTADSLCKYIAFKVDGQDRNTSTTIYIDDVVVETIPACPTASAISATNVTDVAANITWLGTAPTWNMKVSSTPLNNPDTDNANIFTGTATGTPTGASHTLTGLTANTTYYVYLQPNCTAAGNGLGSWSTVFEFTTMVEVGNAPLTCDFEAPNEADSWVFINNSSRNTWNIGSAVNNGGSKALYVSKDNGTSYLYDQNDPTQSFTLAVKYIRFTPGEYEISFDYQCVGEDGFDEMRAFLAPAGYDLTSLTRNTSMSGFNTFFGGNAVNNVSNWTADTKTINFTDTTVLALVFQWENDNYSGDNPPAAIDNIVVNKTTCLSPTTINVSNIQQTSVDIAWTASALNETSWDIRLATAPLGANDPGTVLDTTVNTTTSLALTGLSASTKYFLYLRSNCGANDKGRWTMVNFNTACGVITALPYTQAFTEQENNQLPNCWTDVDSSNSRYDYSDATGDNGYSLKLNGLVAAPNFNVPGTPYANMMVSFNASSDNSSAQIAVGVLTDINDPTTFVAADTISTTVSRWNQHVVLFNNAVPTSGYLAFKLLNTISPAVRIDDVELTERPACLPITQLRADSVGSFEVKLSWTDLVPATNWDIAVTPQGGNPDSVAVKPCTTNPALVTGLRDGQTYDIYVRTNCGSSTGEWSGVRIKTPTEPAVTPYVCGFEVDSINSKWEFRSTSSNVFTIGNGTNNGGNRALYMSDGTTYGYTSNVTTYAYAYRDILMEPGVHIISYDWKCVGEGTYDYGYAYIAPAASATSFGHISTIPSYATSLCNGKMSNKSGWETISKNVTIEERGVYRLIYYWINDYSASNGVPLAIDNVNVVFAGNCIPVDNLNFSYQNGGATITWNAADSTSYHVKVSTSALSDPETATGNILDSVVNGSSVSIANLAYKTTYYAYIKVVCDDSDLPPYATTFTTPCGPVYYYEEDFESYQGGEDPECWNVIGNSYIVNISTGAGRCGFQFNGNEQWAVLPAMASDIHSVTAELNYRIEHFTNSGTITVGVMSDPNDITTFEVVKTLPIPDSVNVWRHDTISFANTTLTGINRYVAFHQSAPTNYYYWIDDIKVGEIRSCNQPQGVVATSVTNNGATLSWNADDATSYNVVIATSPVIPDSVDENTPGVIIIPANAGNTADLTGSLDGNTRYYVYVQADCGNGSVSFWSDEYNFTTACGDAQVPFVDNFNGNALTPNIPSACWAVNTFTNGTAQGEFVSYPYGTVVHGADTCFVMKAYFNAPNSTKICAALPHFNASFDTLQLSFRHKAVSNTTLLIGFMTDASDLSSFTAIDTINVGTTWKQQFVSLRGNNNNAQYVAFMLDGDQNMASSICYIDDVVVDAAAACQAPVNVTAVSTVGNEANISLNTLSVDDQNVQVRISTTLANGDSAINAINNFVVDTTVTVASLPLHVTGLNALTEYNVYARVVCGANAYSPYSDAYTFTTACGDFELPYVQTFVNGIQPNGFPQCWTMMGSGTAPTVTNNGSDDRSSLQWNSAATVALPNLNTTSLSGLTVSFKLSSTTQDSIQLGIISDINDTLSFQAIRGYRPSTANAWEEVSVDLANFVNGAIGGRLAFRANGRVSIDELYVDNTSTCARPTALTATPATTSVQLTWTAGGSETAWEVVVVPQGNNPATGNIVTANTNTITINNLNVGTAYAAYVRATCGANSASNWSAAATFRTQRIAATLPYSCTFEDETENSNWEVNNGINGWFISGAVANNSATSLLVSNNNGITNTYSKDSACVSYASRYMHIDEGLYTFSFNWTGLGDWNNDFVRAFLVPESIDLTTAAAPRSNTTPTNWIALDNNQHLYGQTVWQTKSGTVTVEDGNYNLVFYWVNNTAGTATASAIAIDNINIRLAECYLAQLNVAPLDSSMTISGITDCLTGDIKIYDNVDTTNANRIVDTTNVAFPYHIAGLTPQTTYYIEARGHCSSGILTQWINTTATTLCGAVTVDSTLSYVENFDAANTGELPNCWTLLTTAAWRQPEVTTYTSTSGSKSLDLYGGNNESNYAISPMMGVDSLKNYRAVFSMRPGAADLEMQVGVMTDPNDASTFVKMGTVSGDPNTWGVRHVAFSAFTGTRGYIALRKGVNDNGNAGHIYIDDFTVEYNRIVATVNLTDIVCQGSSYQNNDFYISASEINASTDKQFSHISGDTLYVVTLTVNPTSQTVINDTICAGETYTDNGFNVTTAGTHYRTLTAQNGCDSIITLNLVVNQGDTKVEDIAICQSELPYTWRGTTCTQAGTYRDTVPAPTGCDSIITLNLVVNPEYNVSENLSITDAELPYTYGDTVFNAGTQSGTYVFNYQTTAGCDSIVTLNLSVTTVGVNYAEDGLFAITPNPARRGEVVRIDLNIPAAEREGLIVEMFSNAGALIERREPKENPIYITMPQIDGLYLVRVTTANGKVMYGKVIVK